MRNDDDARRLLYLSAAQPLLSLCVMRYAICIRKIMSKFSIEILTPEKTFFEGEIESLIVETPGGQLGFLKGHSPMVIGLNPAVISMKTDGKERVAANGAGFLAVTPEKVSAG